MKRLFLWLAVFVVSLTTVPSAGALSSDPKTFVSADNTFYAYVKAGETIGATFLKADQNEPFDTLRADVTITLDGPDAQQQKCIARSNVSTGQGCTFAPIVAQKSGIWRVDFDVPSAAKAYPEVSPDVHWGANLFSWNITVKSGSDEQHGRVWTERYALRQPAGVNFATDFDYYYVSEDGYIYKAQYKGYNGQISTLSADGVGVREAATCTSAYQSVDVSSSKFSPAFGSCGAAYKLFFEEPAGNLPATAVKWDGKSDWVRPNISRPSISELHFNSDKSNDQQSGTVSFYLRNFIGQYDVKIDVDNDGSFDGQDDVTIHQQMKHLSGGLQQVHFDGTDRTGQIISPDQKIGVKVAITKVAEIHLVAADVEGLTGGLALTRVSGDNAPTTGICWNDTELTPLAADLMPEQLDGRSCPDSTGGVHGWVYSDGSWGNARYIDNWVYATAKLEGKNQILYPEAEEAAAIASKKNLLPMILAASAVVGVLAGIVVYVIIRRRRRQVPILPQSNNQQVPPTGPFDGTPPTLPPVV